MKSDSIHTKDLPSPDMILKSTLLSNLPLSILSPAPTILKGFSGFSKLLDGKEERRKRGQRGRGNLKKSHHKKGKASAEDPGCKNPGERIFTAWNGLTI
jgi:hypothetical protein